MKKTSQIFFISSLFFLLLILGPLKAKAADGCCRTEETLNNQTVIKFATTSKDYCDELKSPNIVSFWEANKVADNNGCKEKEVDELGTSLPKFGDPIDNPILSVRIPGFSGFKNVTCENTINAEGKPVQECSIPWLAEYIGALYKYGIGAILILAVVIMMIGGVIWLTAAGNDKRVNDAKNYISGSLFGVLIALSSYMILNIVNPALVTLSPIKISSTPKEDLFELQQLDPEDLAPEFTSELSEGSHGTGSGDYKLPIYYQGSYSEPDCMGSSACGPTSLSMILNFHGIDKTPPRVAIDSKERGHWSCSGWTGGMASFQDMLTYYKTNLKTKTGSSFEEIKELLKYGPVIASIRNTGSKSRGDPSRCPFTGKGHYVVFTGYKDGIFYANDPNAGNKGKTEAISYDSFKDKCKIHAGVMAIYK